MLKQTFVNKKYMMPNLKSVLNNMDFSMSLPALMGGNVGCWII